MAPMQIHSGLKGGYASDDTIDYYKARSQAAGMIITEFHYVSENGGPCLTPGYPEQLGIWSDAHIEGARKIASALKQDGPRPSSRSTTAAGWRLGATLTARTWSPRAPSTAISRCARSPRKIILDFGQAVRRAAEAGFDGVEIHGANHYLIQQCFSTNTNHRDDQWGGTLEKRMAFPLAVAREVRRAAAKYARKDFIIGYRMSPEEIHKDGVGYTWHESVQLARKVSELDLDYIHLLLWDGYASKPSDSEKSYGQIFREAIDPKARLVVVGGVFSEEQARDAVQHHGDIVAVGRGTLVEPRFAWKIAHGKGSEIAHCVDRATFPSLDWTPGLREEFTTPGSCGLPPVPGAESILDLHEGIFDKG